MSSHYYAVIMAGGVGSRFWPLSRQAKPKQFLDFTGTGRSFLTQAYDRFKQIVPQDHILVVTLSRYHNDVREHLPDIPEQNILMEPYSRNTAPCIAYAMYSLLKRDPEAVMVISPSDHLITNTALYNETIAKALDYASGHDALVTLGVVPDRPDTNFGYIQVVGGKGAYEHQEPVKVKTFTEKPDADLAKVFLSSGEFLWNSGIFVSQASVMREEMEKYVPQVTSPFRGWETALGTTEEDVFLQRVYTSMERISIDSAIMEKTDKDWLFPAKFGWADIGNWDSLYNYTPEHDASGNAISVGQTLLKRTRQSVIVSDNPDKLIAISDLDNYVVIDVDDVLMIAPRDDKKLKEITANIGMPDFENYR